MESDTSPVRIIDLPLITLGEWATAKVAIWEESPETADAVKIRITCGDTVLEAESERGFFYALRDIRIELSKRNAELKCCGATENVYPSPMIAAMGYGEKAYRLTMGRQALNADLVSIFDVDLEGRTVSTKEQDAYYQRWLASLK